MAKLLSFLRSSVAARGSKRRFSSRPFFLVLFSVLALATVVSIAASLGSRQYSVHDTTFVKRDIELEAEVQECRLVHKAKDQCAFIKANCADHEIGLLSYLQLYYCDLAKAKPVAFTIIALWLALLFSTIGIAASDFLCINLSTIASILGMSESLTGVTFLAFGNGSPDVFSTFAAMSSNSGSLAVGELLGAAGFITAVVAGSMALVRPFRVARRSFVRDIVFFIAASSVSLVFLADGKLHAWECLTMIAFYIFYVITVVSWHWYIGAQRRKRERDMAARAHFHIPDNQELEIEEEEEDDDHPVAAGGGSATRPLLLGASSEDFSDLERAGTPVWKVENVDDDETVRDRYLAELQGNMRISRAPPGQRGLNLAPIRPSLVGALEFRSVLSSLQRSRNFRSGQIHLRRYSDEAEFPNDPQRSSVFDRSHLHPGRTRTRAISAYEEPVHQRGDHSTQHPPPGHAFGHQSAPQVQPGLLFASPTSSGYPSRSQSPAIPRESSRSPSLLAPPEDTFRSPNYHHGPESPSRESILSTVSPRGHHPRRSSGSIGSVAPFPPFQDDDASLRSIPHIRLPSAAGSIHSQDIIDEPYEPKPWRWWPYRYLPAPHALASVLFPTMSGWSGSTIWDKFLAISAAPSVLVLTITLPVVEPGDPEADIPAGSGLASPPPPEYRDLPSSDLRPELYRDDDSSSNEPPSVAVNGGLPDQMHCADPVLNRHRQDSEAPVALITSNGDGKPALPKVWNRWLLAVQLVTAPLFISWALWTNLDSDMSMRNLLFAWFISLLISSVLLAVLFLATTSTTTYLPRRARPLLAFLGFIVAIAWISTLATEVVNLLKTLGVILSISDSLLGLTIFAVGNSLGDLVADITVARLGYPVMALSACFGGPMLNILIGIGVGGLYMTLHGGGTAHESASDLVRRGVALASRGETYHIHVSRSLLISGIALLVTLVGLLIVVPLNGWRMDRKVGVGLVITWCVSTVINVIVEVVG